MTTALKNEIKELARLSVREALVEELMKARAGVLSFISIKEQKGIEKLYNRPSHRAVRTIRIRI
ncbi:MAG: hypothetical protein A3C70_00785 [Candidatus Zambryskibacteria bacterium RIFCSPHIGHO2_02_FULL_43_14]|uniref:Uncharacterized protein n=1 Tax=Candidatus Zambryskibacteria bacterium RIFCSPHIGHO2_02_FULL_43_14 TaxID=1802748 RepID=A0A1G2TE32_9BACT|nr:MAG: hypothetical protein A2829_02830 [Candidatus Zambryskibacteria bacterium RIFCSPHIGHO2_01_FULL_43_60]OHA95547.1 MAG: hypothetical protein A3C70_00785 [Candidatus Zambryskibacteria bacterium RIFCSPHIGHO2_02_FULL_43_14]OHB02901.1 MAG: hypothetical protein A3B03_03225 [Candidatus Zambryskibacteria bacterium RIFCSPLOWO2_01_FULL_42_41]